MLTINNILLGCNQKLHAAITELGSMTEAEMFMTAHLRSGTSSCAVTSCLWSTAWLAWQLSESFGAGKFPMKTQKPPGVCF